MSKKEESAKKVAEEIKKGKSKKKKSLVDKLKGPAAPGDWDKDLGDSY